MLSDPLAANAATIAALGRPQLDWTSKPLLDATTAAIAAWEAANPERVAEYARLCCERDRLHAEADAAYRAKRQRPTMPTRASRAADEPEENAAIGGIRRWLSGEHTWCLLLGSVGAGKSVAAEWACKQVRATGRSAERIHAAELASLSTWDDAGKLDALERVSLLAIDDVGVEARNEHSRALIAHLLDVRHEASRRTLLTSNLSAPDLKAHLGERLADRIRSDHEMVRVLSRSLRGAP